MVFLVAKIGGGALSAMSARLSCFSSIEPLMRTWAWLDRVGMAGRGRSFRARARVEARAEGEGEGQGRCDLLQLLLGGLRSPAESPAWRRGRTRAYGASRAHRGLLVVGEGLLRRIWWSGEREGERV